MNICFRNTNPNWVKEFLIKRKIKNQKFISFSLDENSGSMDNFGDTLVVFNYDKLLEQGAQEIYYDADWFEDNPEICMYVTGYENRENYEYNHDEETDLSWETTIEDYEHEEEIVLKGELIYENGLILTIKTKDEELISLCNKMNIPVQKHTTYK